MGSSILLTCTHGLEVTAGTTGARSVLGSFNPEMLVVATTENQDIANEVMGLPIVVPHDGGALGLRYLEGYVRSHIAHEIWTDAEKEMNHVRCRMETLRHRTKKKGIL